MPNLQHQVAKIMVSNTISALKSKYKIIIYEGECFKQAWYNGTLTDTAEQVKDKLELAIKHYPGKDLFIATFESDETSPTQFAFVVVIPLNN